MPFNFGDEEFNLHDSVSATCSVSKGNLPLKIWWTFAGIEETSHHELETNDEISMVKNGKKIIMLSIDSVKARHRGNYTCYAKNRAGIASFSGQLAINGD